MLRSTIMVMAEGIVRDTETNNVSIFNILEDMGAVGFPIFIQKIFIFNLLTKETADPQVCDCSIRLTNNDIVLNEFPLRLDFGTSSKNRSIFRVHGLAVPNPGILKANFLYSGNELGSYTINLKLSQPPTGTPSQHR